MTQQRQNMATNLSSNLQTVKQLLSSSYKQLGTPQEVGYEFLDFLLTSPRCLTSLQSIAQSLVASNSVVPKKDCSLEVDAFELCNGPKSSHLGNMLLRFPATLLPLLEEAILEALKEFLPTDLTDNNFMKNVCVHARLVHLPPHFGCCKPSIRSIEASDTGKVIQILGKVVRVSPALAFESRKAYRCLKKGCGAEFVAFSDFETVNNALIQPTVCPRKYSVEKCDGNKFTAIPGESKFTDYQEVKIQESVSGLKVGSIPRSLLIKLEYDLVDKCQPGDDVLVVGTLIAQWQSVRDELDCEVGMALRAHSIRVINSDDHATWDGVDSGIGNNGNRDELRKEFRDFWDREASKNSPIATRNFICSAVCPKLYGMLPIKLAFLLTLIGGASVTDIGHSIAHAPPSNENDGVPTRNKSEQFWVGETSRKRPRTETPSSPDDQSNHAHVSKRGMAGKSLEARRRSQPHMLLVGDPGTGKSQFLRFASAISPRSVLTTGVGTTSAGLTCAAVRDSSGKDFTLEAGALVLADRGVCCIDEFGCIRAEDRTTIHEAMEQQTISVAKAGIVCRLNTRATIFAVCNPIGGLYQPPESLSKNTGIGSPLLSRFDFIFILTDSAQEERDRMIAKFLLNNAIQGTGYECSESSKNERKECWSMEKLRSYIATVKDRFQPTVSTAAALLLEKHYHSCREHKNTTVHITVRFFESLIRLSQAHARLMHRNTVTIQDAVAIILLMECSALKCGGLNPSFSNDSSSGLIYCEPLHAGFPDDDEADPLFLKEQSNVLRLHNMLNLIPEHERVEEAENVDNDAVNEQVKAIYDYGNLRQGLIEKEDNYGRKFWSPTPPSQEQPQPAFDHQRRRNAD